MVRPVFLQAPTENGGEGEDLARAFLEKSRKNQPQTGGALFRPKILPRAKTDKADKEAVADDAVSAAKYPNLQFNEEDAAPISLATPEETADNDEEDENIIPPPTDDAEINFDTPASNRSIKNTQANPQKKPLSKQPQDSQTNVKAEPFNNQPPAQLKTDKLPSKIHPESGHQKDSFRPGSDSLAASAKKKAEAHSANVNHTEQKTGRGANVKARAAQAALGQAAKITQAQAQELLDRFADSIGAKLLLITVSYPLIMLSIGSLGIMLPFLNLYAFGHKHFAFFAKWFARAGEGVLKKFLAATGVGAAVTVSVDMLEAALGQDVGSILETIFKRAKMPLAVKVITGILDLVFITLVAIIIFVVVDFVCTGVLGKTGRFINWGVETFTGNNAYGEVCRLYDEATSDLSGTGGISQGAGGAPPGGVINTGQWKEMAKQTAQIHGIDPCIMATILDVESSGGNPNAIGHDHTTPPPPITRWTRSLGGSRKAREGNTHDPIQTGNPPKHGLDWNFSHGIGLTQYTIFANGRGWRDSNTPSRRESGVWYTVQDLLDPSKNLDASARYIKGRIGTETNPFEAFRRYNGSGPDAIRYAQNAMRIYNQCKAGR